MRKRAGPAQTHGFPHSLLSDNLWIYVDATMCSLFPYSIPEDFNERNE